MADVLSQIAVFLAPIGWGAVALVAAGWLAVSFMAPGRGRSTGESLAATGLFAALLALFVHLVADAAREGSGVRMFAFGFLLLLFSLGFAVSCVQTVLVARGAGDGAASATH